MYLYEHSLIASCRFAFPRTINTIHQKNMQSIEMLHAVATTAKKQGYEEIAPYVWHIESKNPGPHAVILGGTHGNEKPGVVVIEKLLGRGMKRYVGRGSLTLGIGNPAAVEADARFVQGDFDLNRSFGKVPAKFAKSIAVKRAKELKPILSSADVLKDVHATIKPSRALILSPNAGNPLLKKILLAFGIGTVITGKALAEDATGMTTDAYVYRQGGVGITLETGGMKDTSIVPRTVAGIMASLGVIGITPPYKHKVPTKRLERFNAYWSVPASDEFAFTNSWPNFARLPEGTHFATDREEKLVVPCDSYMVFQKPAELLKPGTEACLILRRDES
jgi:succinylglutamate desuccinylase